MGRKKSVNEISARINITLPPSVVKGLDDNVNKLQLLLLRLGAEEKAVKASVSRSAVVREFCTLLATEQGYNLVKSGLCLALGVTDNGQLDLFDK